MQNESLESRVEGLYDSALPYHNFDHARRVIATGRDIVERCREEDIPIDAEVVYLALLFHDAGYREDHKALGFDSKEAYSAQLARQYLSEEGYDQTLIQAVMNAIMSTHREGSFVTNEQKAVRAADLFDLGADYETFEENGEKLYQEQKMLTGKDISHQEWLREVERIIGFYLQQEIRLTSYFYDEHGRSVFHTHVRANLDRYLGKI